MPIVNQIITGILKQANEEQKISFSPADGNIEALIDHGLFTSVLQNALGNALKYAGQACQINVSLEQQSSHIIMSINDNGPGIAETDIKQVFEPFYQVDNSRSKEIQGYGLGMAIMKESIEQMQGKITAESAVGKGLLIKCYLLI